MSFIAINAKADITINGTNPTATTKKGKITPAQNAMINAWTLSNKTGVLNFGNKCTTTATVFTSTGNTVDIEFNDGYFVVCGRLVEIEAGTIVSTVKLGEGKQGQIVAKFNLSSTQEGEFSVTAGAKRTLVTNDLNKNPSSGVYEFVLYDFEYTSNGVRMIERDESIYIDDMNSLIANLKEAIGIPDTGIGSAPLDGYNKEKGTIEERLTNLGFKVGSVSDAFANAGATLTAIGKYAILTIPEGAVTLTDEDNLRVYSMSFKIKNELYTYVGAKDTQSYANPNTGVFEFRIVGRNILITKISPMYSSYMSGTHTNRNCSIGFEIDEYEDENGNDIPIG